MLCPASYQRLRLSERHLVPKCSDISAGSKKLLGDMDQCNLIFQFTSDESDGMLTEKLQKLSDDSGVYMNSDFFDFGTLISILESLDKIGPNKAEINQISPIGQAIIDEITRPEYRRTAVGNNLLTKTPVEALLDRIRPKGLIASGEYFEDLGGRKFVTIVQLLGSVNREMALHIPVDRTIDIDHLKHSTVNGHATLYFVIAPNNDVLVGMNVGDNHMRCTPTETLDSDFVTCQRDLGNGLIITDQSYTGAFIFGSPSDTTEGIAKRIKKRCVTNTKCLSSEASLRPIGIVSLGTVSLEQNPIRKACGPHNTDSYVLDHFSLNPGQWLVKHMWYKSDQEDVNLKTGKQSRDEDAADQGGHGDPVHFPLPTNLFMEDNHLPSPSWSYRGRQTHEQANQASNDTEGDDDEEHHMDHDGDDIDEEHDGGASGGHTEAAGTSTSEPGGKTFSVNQQQERVSPEIHIRERTGKSSTTQHVFEDPIYMSSDAGDRITRSTTKTDKTNPRGNTK